MQVLEEVAQTLQNCMVGIYCIKIVLADRKKGDYGLSLTFKKGAQIFFTPCM